jgi:hypothetical protein
MLLWQLYNYISDVDEVNFKESVFIMLVLCLFKPCKLWNNKLTQINDDKCVSIMLVLCLFKPRKVRNNKLTQINDDIADSSVVLRRISNSYFPFVLINVK